MQRHCLICGLGAYVMRYMLAPCDIGLFTSTRQHKTDLKHNLKNNITRSLIILGKVYVNYAYGRGVERDRVVVCVVYCV